MSTTPGVRNGVTAGATLVARRIEDWRRRLIDLSYRNRLIKHRPLRASSLEIVSPNLEVLLADPASPVPWSFYFPPDPDPDRGESDGVDRTEAEGLVDDAVLARARTGRFPRADEIVLTEPHSSASAAPWRTSRASPMLNTKTRSCVCCKSPQASWTGVAPTRDERLRSPLVLVPVRLERLVVHNRLRERGLEDFCLMLHCGDASRREVVSALHASLTSELVPRLLLSEVDPS